jgi:tetrahydromethanopterin S-methyltransferase subunit E
LESSKAWGGRVTGPSRSAEKGTPVIWILIYLFVVFLLVIANHRVHRNDGED